MKEINPRNPYRIQSTETWGLVRTHYLRGVSARELSEQFGVSVSNIRRKAGEEGWTRKNYAETVGPPQRALPAPPRPLLLGMADPFSPPPARTDQVGTPSGAGESLSSTLDAIDASTEPADGEQVAALALGAAARCIAAGRYVEAERLGKLAETLSRLGSPGGGSGGGAGRGAGRADLPEEEPEFPPKPEPFMTPGETKRSPYQVEMLRAEVERRYERLAARFERPKSDALPDPANLDPHDLNEGDAP